MSQSSLFLFHKTSRFRKKLISIAHGGLIKPRFRSVEQLVDYYTQRISKKKRNRIEKKVKKASETENSKDSSDSSERDEEDEINIPDYQTLTDEDKFLQDPNSSAYIEEVLNA